jgi:hypothetical protein
LTVQPPDTTWKHALLSLVVIFTQSIQLSKIVERPTKLQSLSRPQAA